jgi:hypothetical protein
VPGSLLPAPLIISALEDSRSVDGALPVWVYLGCASPTAFPGPYQFINEGGRCHPVGSQSGEDVPDVSEQLNADSWIEGVVDLLNGNSSLPGRHLPCAANFLGNCQQRSPIGTPPVVEAGRRFGRYPSQVISIIRCPPQELPSQPGKSLIVEVVEVFRPLVWVTRISDYCRGSAFLICLP